MEKKHIQEIFEEMAGDAIRLMKSNTVSNEFKHSIDNGKNWYSVVIEIKKKT